MEHIDYILCECELPALQELVTSIEGMYTIQVAKAPSICLTMIKAEDSMEHQPFYLGEALTTDCEVIVNDKIGYGICLGDEPLRSYCMAVVDAVLQLQNGATHQVHAFLDQQKQIIEEKSTMEYNHVLRTKVDFKLMEQE